MSDTETKPTKLSDILEELKKPFPACDISFKPQSYSRKTGKYLACAYADSRAYTKRLNKLCPDDWEIKIEFMLLNERYVVKAGVTIFGQTRESLGEEPEGVWKDEGNGREFKPDPVAAMSAEANALKRACSRFELGSYLYAGEPQWEEVDQWKKFTPEAIERLLKRVPTEDNPEPEKAPASKPAKKQHQKTNAEINKDVKASKDDKEKSILPPADDADFCGFSEKQFNAALKVSDSQGYPSLTEAMLQMGYDPCDVSFDPRSKDEGGGKKFLDECIFAKPWGSGLPEFGDSHPQEDDDRLFPCADEAVPPVDEHEEEIDLDEDDPFKEEV